MSILDDARAEIIGLGLAPRTFRRFERGTDWPPGVSALGDLVQIEALRQGFTVDPPRAALLNWCAWLQPHVDKTTPYPCLNGLVIFREDTTGGELRIGDVLYRCQDEDIVLFDPHLLHEVTPIVGDGYRASLLYYLPWATA